MSLNRYQTSYQAAQPRFDSMYIDPEPGEYQCRVIESKYEEIKAKTSGSTYDRFAWTLEILEGSKKGYRFKRTDFLPEKEAEAEKKLGYIKGAIDRCGVKPPASVMDLPFAMEQCTGAEILVSVVNTGLKDQSGKEIKNIKFLKLISTQQKSDKISSPNPADDIAYYDQPQFNNYEDFPY